MPAVSVIIPVYNAEAVISETINSVLGQSWKDREIIVVDDGSTDGCGKVIRQFHDLRYVKQRNAGVAKARNRGIAEATGRYMALLDHDDLWHPTKLEKQVELLERRTEVGMVITDVAHIDQAGRPMGIVGPGYNPSEAFARLFVQGYVPTPSAAMIRRSVLDVVGAFDEDFQAAGLDDHELWTRIAAHCEIANIGESLTFHRNLTLKPPQVALAHRELMVMKLLSRFGHDPKKRRYLLREQASCWADLGKHLFRQGCHREGRARLLQAFRASMGEALCPKTACRSLARLARSYLSAL